jgi:hypothetical protein
MKVTILILLSLLITRHLQAQCIQNPEFAQTCGATITKDNGETFSDNCVPGWMPSHGRPQIKPNTPNSITNVMYMWAHDNGDQRTRGEGILAPFTFTKHSKYQVTIKYMANFNTTPNTSQRASCLINLVAAQDIRRPSKWKYGNLIPLATRQQDIGTIFDPGSGWRVPETFVFTADENYNEFWIYPTYAYPGNQYNLYIDWVIVCPFDSCASDTYYRSGVIPVEDTKSRQAFIGSYYGINGIAGGTVNVSPTAVTDVRAANSITFKPNFTAQVTSGEFIARIVPCQTYNTRQMPDSEFVGNLDSIDVSQFAIGDSATENTTYEDEYGISEPATKRIIIDQQQEKILKEKINIYPNPGQTALNVDIENKEGDAINLKIINNSGTAIRNYKFTKSYIVLNVGDLPKGIYYIQIMYTNGKIVTKKFVKLL